MTAACIRQLYGQRVGLLCHDGEPQQHDRAIPSPAKRRVLVVEDERC